MYHWLLRELVKAEKQGGCEGAETYSYCVLHNRSISVNKLFHNLWQREYGLRKPALFRPDYQSAHGATYQH
jgi:hypothetical protein